jgi:hypothetical protein
MEIDVFEDMQVPEPLVDLGKLDHAPLLSTCRRP